MIGLPFFVVSTSAPLLQKWFSRTGHKDAADPYFLYAASNFGSLLALVAYPALIEPALPLARQAWVWAGGYVVLLVLTVGCARLLWSAQRPRPVAQPSGRHAVRVSAKDGEVTSAPASPPPLAYEFDDYPDATPAPPLTVRLRWLSLAFVPSSLMLGVTSYASTDLAPIPLLWVIPLSLYLATFIVAFSRSAPSWLPRVAELAAPVFVLMLIFSLVTGLKPGFDFNLFLHFLAFGSVALMCHCELAQRRPSAGRLTEFYLWVSLGGVLGGLFNALVAPIAFRDLYEYPLVLIAAALVLPKRDDARDGLAMLLDITVPAIVAGLILLLYWVLHEKVPESIPLAGAVSRGAARAIAWISEKINVEPGNLKYLIEFGVPALFAYYFVDRPLRFGLSVLALWVVGLTLLDSAYVIHRERSYFGILRVQEEWLEGTGPDGVHGEYKFHKLVHGVTTHGSQLWDPPTNFPLTYYSHTGPVGHVFLAFDGPKQKAHVALVGLGTGSLTSYGKPGMTMTVYEIDAAVRRIATNPDYFTYVRDCKADKLDIVMGDARLMMEKAENGKYGLIFVDAFSSDAIPVHLLTKEAIALYLEKLAPDGIIMLHISNRYLDLQPVCARLMQEHGLAGVVDYDHDDKSLVGKLTSQWVALARRREHFGAMLEQMRDEDGNRVPRWSDLTAKPTDPLWTDDFSNLLQIYDWGFKKKDD